MGRGRSRQQQLYPLFSDIFVRYRTLPRDISSQSSEIHSKRLRATRSIASGEFRKKSSGALAHTGATGFFRAQLENWAAQIYHPFGGTFSTAPEVRLWPIATLPHEFMSAMPPKADNPESTQMTQSGLSDTRCECIYAVGFRAMLLCPPHNHQRGQQ